MIDYTNSRIAELIDEHIHNTRNRELLKRRFIDGVPFDTLAAEFELSPQHVKSIVCKAKQTLFRHL